MEEYGVFMWFEVVKNFKFRVSRGKSKRRMPYYVRKGQKIEMTVIDTADYEAKEAIIFAVFADKPSEGNQPGLFQKIRRYLLLPEKCMISKVGDIFCATDKTVFAVMHFGKSGWWGYGKRELNNPENFKFCPNCGKELMRFPLFPEEGRPLRKMVVPKLIPSHK
ncbi:MAG TPA: hypothetical protein VJ378_02735 [Candidatus Paceibacterota bacterium]|nr:hypothetical protein [Candidatus Paceibacterota bacterium]